MGLQPTPRQYTPRQLDDIEDRLRRLERSSGVARWVEYVPEVTLYTEAYGTSGDPITVFQHYPTFAQYQYIWGAYALLGSTIQLYGHMEQDDEANDPITPFLGTTTAGAYYRVGFPAGVTPVVRHAYDYQIGQCDQVGNEGPPGVSIYRPGNTTRPGGNLAALELWVTYEAPNPYPVVTERIGKRPAGGYSFAYATWAWTGEVTTV